MNTSIYFKYLFLLVFTTLMYGCVQTSPIPGYAKNGDVIVLGLGGINRNAQGATNLNASDLTVTLTGSDNTVYSLRVDDTFQAFPSYNSVINKNTVVLGQSNGLVSFDGAWFAVVSIRDTSGDLLVNLAPGNAGISVSSPAITNRVGTPEGIAGEGDLANLSIEILADSNNPLIADVADPAAVSAFNSQFEYYKSSPTNYYIAPPVFPTGAGVDDDEVVGGAYIVIDYTGFDVTAFEPLVLPSSHNPYLNLSYRIEDDGTGTDSGKIHVYLLNPYGFTSVAERDTRQSVYTDLSLVLETVGTVAPADIATAFTLNTAETYYIDDAGDILPGYTPSMTHVSEL